MLLEASKSDTCKIRKASSSFICENRTQLLQRNFNQILLIVMNGLMMFHIKITLRRKNPEHMLKKLK